MKTIIIHEPNKLYFTSDTHFLHENIIKYCNRPFNNIGHMDEVIVNNWNSMITDDDTIFHLGDFCWGGKGEWIHFMHRLRGKKILIQGNHDRDKDIPIEMWNEIYPAFVNIEVKDDKPQRITLCHYPMISWHQSHKGAWQFFGHMHNASIKPQKEHIEGGDEVASFLKEEYKYSDKLRYDQYDVGVDGNDYSPISYYQIKKIIESKK